jgi:hypothetical protein
MSLSHRRPDSALQLGESLAGPGLTREDGFVHVSGAESPDAPHNNAPVLLFIPFENGAGTEAKLTPNLGWYGDLALSGELGLSERHGLSLPR